jgi:hypothetical protein
LCQRLHANRQDKENLDKWTGRKDTKRNKAGKQTRAKDKERKKAEGEGNKPKPSHPPWRQVARAPPPPYGGRGCRIMVTASRERGGGQLKIQLIIQRIPDTKGGMCTVLWDAGAQISLMTHQYAKEARFRKHPASIQISGVGAGNKNESNVQYKALLRRRDRSIAEFTPYGVDKITGDAVSMNLDKTRALFPFAACKLESPAGPVHMLIGMDHMEDAPQERDRAQGVVLYYS